MDRLAGALRRLAATPPDPDAVASVAGEEEAALADAGELTRRAFADAVALAWSRSEAVAALEAAERDLHDAELRRAEVTAGVAHELRTPLTTIRGFIETLLIREDALDGPGRRHMLEISLRNAVDLTHRIAALLEHAKLEADHVSIDPRAQPLLPALRNALDDCAGLLGSHHLRVEVPDELEVVVDEIALDHVVANLVSNSVKYAADGSTIAVRATLTDDGSMVVVSVADEGVGIPAEDVPHVFDRFYRGDDRGRRRRGTGIGLAIVKRYVELGGGQVWIESIEGRGTTVRFTLPCAGEPRPTTRSDAVAVRRTVSC